jgi:hypothetical protein
MIERIVAHVGIWLEAIQSVNSWLYFDRRNVPKEIADKVRALFDELMPTHPVDLVVLYTHGWQTDFSNPDVDYDPVDPASLDHEYVEREARRLADAIAGDEKMLDAALHRLVTSEAKTVFVFATAGRIGKRSRRAVHEGAPDCRDPNRASEQAIFRGPDRWHRRAGPTSGARVHPRGSAVT